MDINYAGTEWCIAKKYRYYGSFTLFHHPRTRLIGLDKIMAMGLFSQSNDTCGQWRSHTARDQDWEQDGFNIGDAELFTMVQYRDRNQDQLLPAATKLWPR